MDESNWKAFTWRIEHADEEKKDEVVMKEYIAIVITLMMLVGCFMFIIMFVYKRMKYTWMNEEVDENQEGAIVV